MPRTRAPSSQALTLPLEFPIYLQQYFLKSTPRVRGVRVDKSLLLELTLTSASEVDIVPYVLAVGDANPRLEESSGLFVRRWDNAGAPNYLYVPLSEIRPRYRPIILEALRTHPTVKGMKTLAEQLTQ